MVQHDGLETHTSKCPIEHVVILMLENQSFDRVLGFVAGDLHTNEDGFTPEADPVSDHAFDPPHSFDAVTKQTWGERSYNEPPLKKMHCLSSRIHALHPTAQRRFLRCFADGSLPVLHELAKSFVVCNRWFCSVPGPTAPNKMFAHAATSDGYVGGKWLHEQGTDVRPEVRTIFESLEDNARSWAVYGHKSLMTCKVFPYVRARAQTHIHSWDRFFADCAAGTLPNYSWLVPELSADSQHPGSNPACMLNGDLLLGRVYEAIRNNPEVWKSTLLVLMYDEAGGFPDSVVPQQRVHSVSGPLSQCEPQRGFNFEFLGPRVPTLLISGYLPSGIADSRTYEHASIARSIKDLFALTGGSRDDGYLTARDAVASSWWDNGLFHFQKLRDGDAPQRVLHMLHHLSPGGMVRFCAQHGHFVETVEEIEPKILNPEVGTQLRWDGICGPRIAISGGGAIATDIAKDAKSGDDDLGRYRVVLSGAGFSGGRHAWGVRVLEKGRVSIGVIAGSSGLQATWRESNGKALHQLPKAWIICLPSGDGDAVNRWNNGKSVRTGLPHLKPGEILQLVLDCEAGTPDFVAQRHTWFECCFFGLASRRDILSSCEFRGRFGARRLSRVTAC